MKGECEHMATSASKIVEEGCEDRNPPEPKAMEEVRMETESVVLEGDIKATESGNIIEDGDKTETKVMDGDKKARQSEDMEQDKMRTEF